MLCVSLSKYPKQTKILTLHEGSVKGNVEMQGYGNDDNGHVILYDAFIVTFFCSYCLSASMLIKVVVILSEV